MIGTVGQRAGEDDGEDGPADRAAETLDDVDLGGGVGQLVAGDRGVRGGDDRHDREPDRRAAEQQERLEHQVRGVRGEERERQRRGDAHRGSGRGDNASAMAVGQPAGERHDRGGAGPERDQRESGRECVLAAEQLEVQREDDRRAEERRAAEGRRGARGRVRALAIEPQVEQRVRMTARVQAIGDQAAGAHGEWDEVRGGQARALARARDGVDEQREADADEAKTTSIELRRPRAGRRRDDTTGEQQPHDADRQVDQEHPAPRESVDDQAADHWPECGREAHRDAELGHDPPEPLWPDGLA